MATRPEYQGVDILASPLFISSCGNCRKGEKMAHSAKWGPAGRQQNRMDTHAQEYDNTFGLRLLSPLYQSIRCRLLGAGRRADAGILERDARNVQERTFGKTWLHFETAATAGRGRGANGRPAGGPTGEYGPETAADCQLVHEAARSVWVLNRNNLRYDEIEQTLYEEQRDSTLWTEEQWRRLELRTRYRTTAERSWMRAMRGLEHVRRNRVAEEVARARRAKLEAETRAIKGHDSGSGAEGTPGHVFARLA